MIDVVHLHGIYHTFTRVK